MDCIGLENDLNASHGTLLSENVNQIMEEQGKENSFVGLGENENLAQNIISPLAKKIKKLDSDTEIDSKEPNEVNYLCKVVQKLVTENYSPLKTSDFPDKESIINALNTVLLSISRNDNLMEWIESSSHFFNLAESFTDFANGSTHYPTTSSPRESLESSLGILSYTDLSSFSSNEALKIENSNILEESVCSVKQSFDYLSEIEDLKHQNKRLHEEKGHIREQMAQTEEMNTNLYYENEDLTQKCQNMQSLLEKMRETEKDYVKLKVTLSNYEDSNQMLLEKLTNQQKERLTSETRIRDLNEEITMSNKEIDTLKLEVDKLNGTLAQSKVELNYLRDINEMLNQDLQDKLEALLQKERQLTELLTSNEYIKAQKCDLEVQLCRAEEEIVNLQHFAQNIPSSPSQEILQASFSCSHIENCFTNCDCANCSILPKSDQSKAVDFLIPNGHSAPLSPIQQSQNCVTASTPNRQKTKLIGKLSLCAEMKDVVRSKGTPLPSPFCGKHIFPAALYHEVKVSLFEPSTDKRKICVSFDETDSISCKVPKLSEDLDSGKGQSSIASSSNPFENIVKELSFYNDMIQITDMEYSNGFFEKLLQDLRNVNLDFLCINAANESITQHPNRPEANGGGVINEPPPPSNNPNVVEDSLKDQINVELKVLRSQIAKTQAILSYLSRGQKLPAGIASLNSFIVEKDVKQRAKSEFSGSFNRLSGDLLATSDAGHKKSYWSREHVRNPSYSPSQKSTPLHRSRWLTKSCPNLPSQWSVINRSTQTDYCRMANESPFVRTPTSDMAPKTPSTPLKSATSEKIDKEVSSPPNNNDDLSITVSPLALRNRSLSYVNAIKKGNLDDVPDFLAVNQDVVIVHDKTPDIKSSPSLPEDSNKNIIDNGENMAWRKLSVLPEEPNEERLLFIHHKNCSARRLSRSFDETGTDSFPEVTTGSARDLNRNYINSLSLPLVSFNDPRLSRSVEATFTKLHLNRVPLDNSGTLECKTRPPPYRHPPPASSKSAESLTSLPSNLTLTKKQMLRNRFASTQELGRKVAVSDVLLEKQSSLPSSFCYPNSGTTYRDRSNGEQYIIRTVGVPEVNSNNKSTGSRAILIPRSGLSRANHSLKDVASSAEDDLEELLHDNHLNNTLKTDNELECELQNFEPLPRISEKAKKRRRSFSEHKSSYSGTIDLEEHETDSLATDQMQGPFLSPGGQALNESSSDTITKEKLPVTLPVSLSPPSLDVSVVKFPKASAAFNARAALSDKPKRIGRTPRFLMPDVMETSETESAKDSANGSMESETTEAAAATTTTTVLSTATTSVTITSVASAVTASSNVEIIKPPPAGLEPSFPSLPDDFLKKLNLEKSSALNTEEMTAQEVESKFGTLSLAFKTDKFTLSKRLELQKRQRDMAEGNIDKEVTAMREALNALNHMCTDSQMRDLIVKVQHHIDIVHQSTSRMSSRAEVYGAVQQEERMSHAYEIMVTYVENLKRLYQKEHHELEDTRRVLIENRLLPENNAIGSGSGASGELFGSSSDDPKRPTRTSIASGSYKPQQQQQSTRRRASVAVFHRPILEAAKSCIGTLSNFGASASNGEFRARLYSAVTPLSSSLSPAKLERLNAVAITSGAAVSSSSPSPPVTPSTASSTTNNQRFPFPSVSSSPSYHGGHLRKLAIGSSVTGPLNSLNGNEELLAVLERVEAADDDTSADNNSPSEEKAKENNNNEVYNEEPNEPLSSSTNSLAHRRPNASCYKSNLKGERRITPPASQTHQTNTTSRSAFNPYPYYRQLSRIILRSDPIRQNSWFSSWLPDDGWWSHWDFSVAARNLRYSFGAILFLGALISVIVTFLPSQTSACCNGAMYASSSVQEFFEGVFRPYVMLKNNKPPV